MPNKSKNIIKEVLALNPRRKANFCEECKEYVEEPMMICRYDGPNEATIFIRDENTKKLARMLEVAIEELEMIRTGHERTDDHPTAIYSNLMRLKAACNGAENALIKMEEIAEEENG